MRPSHLDKLPDSVQKTIYNVFINASLRDKVIFLSRLDHGNEMSYKEIGDTLGVTFQRVQQVVDCMFSKVKKSPNITMLSGVMW